MGFEKFQTVPTFRFVVERDVDLMLVEEIRSSSRFLCYLCQAAGLAMIPSDWRVLHSLNRTESRRETDIHVEIVGERGEEAVLLVENKITALDQIEQAESYREEVMFHRVAGRQAAMLITAPHSYLLQNRAFVEKFDTSLSYEAIAAHFSGRSELREAKNSHDELASRLRHRADLMLQAAGATRRLRDKIVARDVVSFNEAYVGRLRLRGPAVVPGKSMVNGKASKESTSMIFDTAATLHFIDKDIPISRFAHELGCGKDWRANYVAVTFRGWAAYFSELDDLFRGSVPSGTEFKAPPPSAGRLSRGLVMMFPTPAVDHSGDFDAQISEIDTGIDQVLEAVEWLKTNRVTLRRWKEAIDRISGTV